MASRPVFMPSDNTFTEVNMKTIEFEWVPGLSKVQKMKSVRNLHLAARLNGIDNILEISSKSDVELGIALSAFNLLYFLEDTAVPVECIFQCAKVFEQGGPFEDIKYLSPKEAKRDDRLKSSGNLIGFEFEGLSWELTPETAFYDWIYINAISKQSDLLKKLKNYSAFTDIEFNPVRQKNCQARSVALLKTLMERGTLDNSLKTQSAFLSNYNVLREMNAQLDLFSISQSIDT